MGSWQRILAPIVPAVSAPALAPVPPPPLSMAQPALLAQPAPPKPMASPGPPTVPTARTVPTTNPLWTAFTLIFGVALGAISRSLCMSVEQKRAGGQGTVYGNSSIPEL